MAELMPPGRVADDPVLPSSSLGDVWTAALAAQRDVANPLARQRVLDEEYQRRIDEVEKATGVRLFHPRRDMPTPDDFREAQDEAGGWQSSVGIGAATTAAERRFHRQLMQLGEQHPDKGDAIRAGTTVWDDAYARVRKAEATNEDVLRRSPTAVDVPLLGPVDPVGMLASMWGWAHDPVNLATSVIGPGGSAARGILWNASRQAVAGMMQQAAVEPFAQAWRAEAGLDFGWRQAAGNLLMAGVAGGALDAAGRSLNRSIRGKPLGGTPEPPRPANDVAPPAPPREPEAALDAAVHRLPEDNLARRAAEGDAGAIVELTGKLGVQADDPAAVRGALEQFKFETLQETSIREALGAADVEDRLAAQIRHLADPEAEPPSRPAVADVIGRSTEPVPLAPETAALLPADALERLRQGDLDPVTAARLIRDVPELAAELPGTTDLARGIHALSRLSDDGLAAVEQGSILPSYAAIVADAAPPARHAGMIERLAALAPRDEAEARRLVAAMMQAPTDAGTASRILGLGDPPAAAAADGPLTRTRAPEFDEPLSDGAKLQAESLKSLEERALDAVTGSGPAPAWMRELVDTLEAAKAEGDEAALVTACKLF
ncbi:MAG: hypothetical protein AB7O57_04185 [Hyphomicrobiaceae bacterium]